jgi:hypothetical protein
VRDSSVGEARRGESAVVCQQPPVLRSPQLGNRRWSRARGFGATIGTVALRSRRLGGVARVLAVGSDHPAIRGAVIAFVTERSCRRRAWSLLMGDCRTSIGDVGEQEPTSALRAGCLRPRGSELATEPPAAREPSSCDTRPGPADRREQGARDGMPHVCDTYAACPRGLGSLSRLRWPPSRSDLGELESAPRREDDLIGTTPLSPLRWRANRRQGGESDRGPPAAANARFGESERLFCRHRRARPAECERLAVAPTRASLMTRC